jgi:hypothetical protein
LGVNVACHRERRRIHLIRQRSVAAKYGSKQQRGNEIALSLRSLPHAQVLESIHTHG